MKQRSIYQRWAAFICYQTGLDKEKEEVFAYALEILVVNIGNLCLTLLVGWLLKVLPGTVACIAVATAFRHTSGGAHSGSPWRCAIATMTIFPLLALLAHLFTSLPDIYHYILAILALLIGTILTAVYAPVDSEAAPIISESRRKRLKRNAMLVLAAITVTMILLAIVSGPWADEIMISISLSLVWVSFNLTDFAKRMWRTIDRVNHEV